MKLGVLTALFSSSPLEAALDRVKAHDLDAVELGTGNYPGDAHCNPDELLDNGAKLEGLRHAVASRGLVISALSCHGNPLHPSRDIARDNHETFIKTVRLARRLDVDRVCLFSGCPGDSDNARYPNWVTCAWPTEYKELVEWQWTEKVIPYWREQAAFSASHGVRLCFEMHPGFAVYNPETLLRLRSAAGETVGANFDPSHLYWQGIDPAAAIRTLGDARSIFHVHAKDTMINKTMTSQNGVLDTKPLSDARTRSWIFRTVGYGHDQLHWREIISALRTAGYDDVLSIEHEDWLASVDEGFKREVDAVTRGYADKREYFIDKLSQGIGTIAAAFWPNPVILRFSDFKTNEYAHLVGGAAFEPHEENPMLGWRGASRYYHPEYKEGFLLEVAAVRRVRERFGLKNLTVMVPFCRTPEEGRRVLDVMREGGLVRGEDGLEVYVMAELPSNVILAEQFADVFDGFSIGSNDLTQLVLGVDRDSDRVAGLFDERNEAVRRACAELITKAHRAGRKVGICGQAPSDYPEFAAFLVDEGIDSISLNPDAVVSAKLRVIEAERRLAGTRQAAAAGS